MQENNIFENAGKMSSFIDEFIEKKAAKLLDVQLSEYRVAMSSAGEIEETEIVEGLINGSPKNVKLAKRKFKKILNKL